jgi:serine/threonine protein phosphatase PrpC
VSPLLRYAARSDVGLVRDGNEDSLYAGPHLLAVADGVGGAAAGEVASSVAIASLAPLDEDTPAADLADALHAALRTAVATVRDMVAADNELEGMGTTLTAMLCDGSRAALLHIGDSRAYQLRAGTLRQLTHDHTLVQNLIDEGRLTREEAETHPARSMITKSIDGRVEMEPDLSVFELKSGDRYLLCTDGLSGVVSDETLQTALELSQPQEAVDKLIELALRAGGPDNVTCIVAHVLDDATAGTGQPVVGGAAALHEEEPAPPDTAAGRAALLRRRLHLRRPAPVAPTRTRRRWLVPAVVALCVLVLAGAALAATIAFIRSQWYVGIDRAGGTPRLAVFQGVSGSFAGIQLSAVKQRTLIAPAELPPFEREQATDGISASSLRDARRIVRLLQADVCSAWAAAHPAPQPTPRTRRSRRVKRPTPPPGCRSVR